MAGTAHTGALATVGEAILIIIGDGTTHGDITVGAGVATTDGEILTMVVGAMPVFMAGVVTTTTVGDLTIITTITEETTHTDMLGDVEDIPLPQSQAPHLGEGPT